VQGILKSNLAWHSRHVTRLRVSARIRPGDQAYTFCLEHNKRLQITIHDSVNILSSPAAAGSYGADELAPIPSLHLSLLYSSLIVIDNTVHTQSILKWC
jgi:hypothetical protein